MAKPTDEIIKLPDTLSLLVRKFNDGLNTISIEEKVDNATDNIQPLKFEELSTSLQALFNQESDKGLIVYFYPRDNTAGCTTQAQDFSAMKQQFTDLGYAIVGISRDSIESHKKFIDKKELTIDLISDSDEQLCQHFDVIKEKNMYGKKVLGLVRSTFIFNKVGVLTHAQRNLRAKGYAERLISVLQA